MRVPTDNKIIIKNHLLKKGCLVVEDNIRAIHPELNIPNFHVMQMMRSFVSKGYVSKVFVWRHGYYFLKVEGAAELKKEMAYEEQDVPVPHGGEKQEQTRVRGQ
ncbi:ribosomal protein S10 [Hamiltosporidium tvaerminnensis]|uniref:Ribosomal protein S10 n=2 Tax=Hamiltosporidium TaxID=1176354 RepID=A0A4Q9LLN9_9MICR|nr:ribosomal 40S subunit protein S10A [Hamiltosporidium tvaerminnensis]TBU02206.1 ribosomal protein S10 [Hamiltosporidium tvaerminnensis]TBU08395.1 ribosomal protein S10 [Hamiltosporidium magnivora]